MWPFLPRAASFTSLALSQRRTRVSPLASLPSCLLRRRHSCRPTAAAAMLCHLQAAKWTCRCHFPSCLPPPLPRRCRRPPPLPPSPPSNFSSCLTTSSRCCRSTFKAAGHQLCRRVTATSACLTCCAFSAKNRSLRARRTFSSRRGRPTSSKSGLCASTRAPT